MRQAKKQENRGFTTAKHFHCSTKHSIPGIEIPIVNSKDPACSFQVNILFTIIMNICTSNYKNTASENVNACKRI